LRHGPSKSQTSVEGKGTDTRSKECLYSNPVQKTTEGGVQYQAPFNLDNLRCHLAEVKLVRRVLPEETAARGRVWVRGRC
jgi:hypothetical protein